MNRIPLLAALALLLTACGGSTGEPGAFALDATRIPIGSSAYDIAIVRSGQPSSLGEVVQSAERSTVDGRDVIRFVLEQRMQFGTMIDTLDVDAESLRPIRYRNLLAPFQSVSLDYAKGGHVVGTVTRAGETVAIDTVLTGTFFDGSGFQPLLAALPLAEGYSARVPIFAYDVGTDSVGVKVVGQGSVVHQGADRPVWLVEYTTPGGNVATLAIDRESGSMLRTEASVGTDAVFVQSIR